ncbi:MAG: rRNA processing protein [Chrysothrix sp. TS-e1954]|nr:MAG: rRNA processing protein [Chrysothrix sp. TS-e1954]
MGSSAKRKKEKKKDFQKPKLKVGKDKPKPANFTDTSFKAGAIHLSRQSINVEAPSTSKTFSHHVSMLRHQSATQRQESLAFLTSLVADRSSEQSLPEPMSVFLPRVCQLMLDPSNGVRQQLLKLLHHVLRDDVRVQIGQLLHWVIASMMQMSVDISLFSLDVLSLMLGNGPLDVVSSIGGWTKVLNCFLKVLGWQQQSSKTQQGWTQMQREVKIGSQGKTMAKQLNVLSVFIKAGMAPPTLLAGGQRAVTSFPLTHVDEHMMSTRSNAFAHLNLFGTGTSDENRMLEDREDRQRLFTDIYEKPLLDGIERVKREGGEVGRASAALAKAIAGGLADFERDQT